MTQTIRSGGQCQEAWRRVPYLPPVQNLMDNVFELNCALRRIWAEYFYLPPWYTDSPCVCFCVLPPLPPWCTENPRICSCESFCTLHHFPKPPAFYPLLYTLSKRPCFLLDEEKKKQAKTKQQKSKGYSCEQFNFFRCLYLSRTNTNLSRFHLSLTHLYLFKDKLY